MKKINSPMDNQPRYYMGGRRWTPISKDYFETVLIDFFGRPDGWWHHPILLEVPGKVGIRCTPKRHSNRIGLSQNLKGEFVPVRWAGRNNLPPKKENE